MEQVVLEIKNLSKVYESKGAGVKALTDVSLTVNQGETIGIVGESGCGKTTLGRCIIRAYDASKGQVFYRTKNGEELDFLKVDKKKMNEIRKEIQMIFQDPCSSLDPRMTVLDIIKEHLKANYPKMPKGEIPNPANPPSGCYFHERCHYCIDKCRTDSPESAQMPDGRLCACHRAKELALRGFT